MDVTFGDGPQISADECSKLGDGAIIGYSPMLCKDISRKLTKLAEENDIPHNFEVMGDHTGTNADMLGISREGVKACTLSVPLRNMHAEVETLDLGDLLAVCDLLEKYILSGGILNG